MSGRFVAVTISLAASVAFLLGLVVSGAFAPAAAPIQTVVTRPPVAGTPMPAAGRPVIALAGGVDFADIAGGIDDAVVNISALSKRDDPRASRRSRRLPDPGDPADPDADRPGVPQQGAGSGFLIDADGYLFTNHHVIEGAERITVTLADGRTFRGTVVGADPAIDVALLKIEAPGPLPVAPLGDSDQLRVGEWVCAIGNPLGYVHSVTVGVVSFIGRKLFDPSLDDYIQTDAAINLGNSGGPLINSRGEVIGINSAISQKASSIGFAIPINQAVEVLPQLRAFGRVSRGYIGVSLVDVTPDLQRSLRLSGSDGALVLDVGDDSPGARAGLKVYDLIEAVDRRKVVSNDDLIRQISVRQPGSTVALRITRDGRELVLQVKLAERPATDREAGAQLPDPGPDSQPAGQVSGGRPTIGLGVRDLDDAFVRRFGLPDAVRGVVVSRVDTAGAAYGAGIRRGFLILEINRRPVRTAGDFERALAAAHPGDALALYVYNPIPGQRDLIAVTVDDSR